MRPCIAIASRTLTATGTVGAELTLGTVEGRGACDVYVSSARIDGSSYTAATFRLYARSEAGRVLVDMRTMLEAPTDGTTSLVLSTRGRKCDAYEVTVQTGAGAAPATNAIVAVYSWDDDSRPDDMASRALMASRYAHDIGGVVGGFRLAYAGPCVVVSARVVTSDDADATFFALYDTAQDLAGGEAPSVVPVVVPAGTSADLTMPPAGLVVLEGATLAMSSSAFEFTAPAAGTYLVELCALPLEARQRDTGR